MLRTIFLAAIAANLVAANPVAANPVAANPVAANLVAANPVAANPVAANLVTATDTKPDVPRLTVPRCPAVGTVDYSTSVPKHKLVQETQVDLCYTDTYLAIKFTARDEVGFHFRPQDETNSNIAKYEVLAALIYRGMDDPQTYLEFEVSPNNVTSQAFVYNPSMEQAPGWPFERELIPTPAAKGFNAATTLDQEAQTWVSAVRIPLDVFGVDSGEAGGTKWRMNFFRTTIDLGKVLHQNLTAWSVPDKRSFHMSRYFGRVNFV